MKKPCELKTKGMLVNRCALERLEITGRPASFPEIPEGAEVICSIEGPGDDEYTYGVCESLEQMQYVHDEIQKGTRPVFYELEWCYANLGDFLIPLGRVKIS